MKRVLLATFLLLVTVPAAAPQSALVELLARAKSLELDTPYVPPPGDRWPTMRRAMQR